MRALKEIISHTTGKVEKEMLVCKLWITVSERAVTSSGVTATSVNLEFRTLHLTLMDRDGVVGMAILYGLAGSGIEPRWKRDIPQSSRPALGPTQPPVQWVTGLLSGGKGVEA